MTDRSLTASVNLQLQKVKQEVEKLIKEYEILENQLEKIERANPVLKSQMKSIKNTVGQFKRYFKNFNEWTVRKVENVNSKIDSFFAKGVKKVEEEKKELETKITKLEKLKGIFKKI